MAQKKFKQFFAKDFTGIDGESTPLEPDAGGCNRAVNLEYAVGNSLRGRVGCQILGTGFFGIFPHTYTRTQPQYDITYASTTLTTTSTAADGASITRLIGLNQQVWVLDQMTIPVTRVSGSYPFTWYSYVKSTSLYFQIKANGVSVIDKILGDGLPGGNSIYAVLDSINLTAELSINPFTRGTCPPLAVVNVPGGGTTTLVGSSTYGTRYSITVDAGHTFYPGDVITFNLSTGLVGGIVTARTATTITYAGPQVTFADNDQLGYMGQDATCFPITTAASAASGDLNLVFPYWRLLPEGDATNSTPDYGAVLKSSYTMWQNKSAGSFYAPPTAVNTSGCLFLASSGQVSDGSASYPNNLLKIDGTQVSRAGIDVGPTFTLSAPGAGALTGSYKYKAFYRRYDAQGNIVEGTPSAVVPATYAAQYGQYVGSTSLSYPSHSGFQVRSCFKYTTEAPAAGAAFTVDDNSAAPGLNAFVQPGDPLILMDNTAQKVGLWRAAFGVDVLGTIHKTYCTFYDGTTTPSSIKAADSNGYTINNNTEISTGITLVVLRTTAGGNQFYVLCEIPVTGYAFPSFFDNVTDAVLSAGEQYIEVTLNKEHDPPLPCSLVCQHQAGLITARGISNPNTVGYSSIDGIEYFPLASNSFDVPSTQSGQITAIASDTYDRLGVFKERAYYDIAGDLDGGAFSVNVRNEGDFGITSQASLIRVQDTLVGLSRNGFVLVRDGQLNWQAYKELNTRLIDQDYLFEWAVGVNDPLRRSYACTIPISGAEPVTFVIDYSREAQHTFERSYPTKIDPAGGYAAVGNEFWHLSQTSPYGVFRRLERFDGNSPSGNGDGDSFIDNTSAISYILETNPITNNEPDILNTPIRLRLWSLPNDYVEEGWVPFSTLVEGGSSPLVAYVGAAYAGGTGSTVTFSTTNDIFKDVKLVSTKTHFYIVRLTTNTIRTSPFWTGFEILYAESYDPEDLIK